MGYNGEMREGKFHGKGKLIEENGNEQEGEFQLGDFHGEGNYIIDDKLICEGKWVRGELIEGSLRDVSGNFLYEGEIKDFKRHGKGTYFNYKDKKKFEAYWEDDELVEGDDWDCQIIE